MGAHSYMRSGGFIAGSSSQDHMQIEFAGREINVQNMEQNEGGYSFYPGPSAGGKEASSQLDVSA